MSKEREETKSSDLLSLTVQLFFLNYFRGYLSSFHFQALISRRPDLTQPQIFQQILLFVHQGSFYNEKKFFFNYFFFDKKQQIPSNSRQNIVDLEILKIFIPSSGSN